jgi:hypothetical protein
MYIHKKLFAATVFAVYFAVGMAGKADAATIIAPNNLATKPGNFPGGFLTPTPSRLQQVYAASQFGSKPLKISQVALRPSSTNPLPFDFTIENIQFNLSTTLNNPDALNTNFAVNVGNDNTQVFNGTLKGSTTNSQAVGGTQNFDILIPFSNPFIYNPSQGNLLLDVKKFSSEVTGSIFDGEFTLGDAVSTLIAVGDANAAIANPRFSSTLGFVTQFTATPIPESSSFLGTLAVVVLSGGLSYKHKKQNILFKK